MLIVDNGSGDGEYTTGTIVTVSADQPAPGQQFAGWTGDISILGPEQALQEGANATHQSDPAFDTADFADTAPGNLRADYVLPRKNMKIADAAVFWPTTDDPLFPLVSSSDHRLVWIDVRIRGTRSIHDDEEDEDEDNEREEEGLRGLANSEAGMELSVID